MHCVNLFLYLWAKNDSGHTCPYVKIPTTLIIRNGDIRFWFYMDENGETSEIKVWPSPLLHGGRSSDPPLRARAHFMHNYSTPSSCLVCLPGSKSSRNTSTIATQWLMKQMELVLGRWSLSLGWN